MHQKTRDEIVREAAQDKICQSWVKRYIKNAPWWELVASIRAENLKLRGLI